MLNGICGREANAGRRQYNRGTTCRDGLIRPCRIAVISNLEVRPIFESERVRLTFPRVKECEKVFDGGF